jgi:hypothetical protein
VAIFELILFSRSIPSSFRLIIQHSFSTWIVGK